MQIPVVVEPDGFGQFRAQGPPPFTSIAAGATSEEALSNLREQLRDEVKAGKQVVLLDVSTGDDNPWLAMAGWLKDDPLFGPWQESIREYREECDREAGIEINKVP